MRISAEPLRRLRRRWSPEYQLGRDVRIAFRQLARTPSFTVPAVASLALGIAVNATLFSVVSAALLRPFAVPGAAELVRIGRSERGGRQFRSLEYEEFVYLREHATSFAGLTGEEMGSAVLGGGDDAETVAIELVAPDYFDVLRVPPALGRGFLEEEALEAGDAPVAVVSDRLWRRAFGADPTAVGRDVVLNNVRFAVAGVARPGFAGTFPGVPIDVWLPAGAAAALGHRPDGGLPTLQLIGRLREGVGLAAAGAELDVLARRLAAEDPGRDPDRTFAIARAEGVHPALAQPLRVFLLLLMAVVGVVLLIACANVASLLLARASHRQGELTVRLALGAGRVRVVGQLLVESLVLAVLGGLAGLALSAWPVRLLNAVFTVPGPAGAPTFLDLRLDGRVLAFTAAITTLTVLVFGLLPALRATRLDLGSALRDAGRLPGRARSRLRSALAVVQVAISFVLLVGALLLFRSLGNSERIALGFEPDGVVVASFGDLAMLGYDAARVERFYAELLDRVCALPGVERAALASFVPMGGGIGHPRALVVPGEEAAEAPAMPVASVSDGYFAAVRQPLLRGRDFTARDAPGAPRVAIVNEAMARRFWPRGDALGMRIGLGEDALEHTIVGVVADARFASFGGSVEPFVFVPAFPMRGGTLHVRTAASPADVLADIRRVAHEIEASLPPFAGRTMREAMATALVPARIARVVFGAAGAIALVLAAGGLYGLVWYTLERRLREVGIRVALGAGRRSVFWLIVGGAVRLAAVGVIIGVAVAAAALRLLSALLYGVSPTDPLTLGGIAALLLLATLGAGYAAARKGLDADPMAVLRYE